MKSKKILYIILAGLIVVLALSVVNFTIKAFKDKDIDVINIDTDEVVTKGEEKKLDVQKKSNKKDALESFSYVVAQKIYNSIRSNM